MNENLNNSNYEQTESEIDIMEYVVKLLKNWKFILKWGCVALVVGITLVFDLPKSYTSQAMLAPEVSQRNTYTSMSAMAAMAGVNINNAIKTDAMYPDLYPEIVVSSPFLVELFSIPVSFTRKKELIETDLYTYLKEYGKSPWWKYVTGLPMKAIGWGIKLFTPKNEEEEVEGYATIDPSCLTKEQSRIAKALSKSIIVNVDKKTFLTTVDVTFQDPKVAKVVCEEVVSRLQKYVVHYRTEKARVDVKYFEKLAEEAQENYYEKQQRYAKYVDSNQGLSLHSVRIEQERLQNETSLAFSLYNQTSQQLQLAKAKVQQETPVCLVVQPASVPLKGSPSKAKSLLMIIFAGVAIACAWVLFGDMAKDFLKDIKGK
ncbi:MAG: chain-length determining protein [Bacteroidales bacterium]|nr:chain-length determining protein [Candidatus Cryptobacteroides equifaecalis]